MKISKKLFKNSPIKRILLLAFKYRVYLPTAFHALWVFKHARIVPWVNRKKGEQNYVNPFNSLKEKQELIRRANWLCREVIVDDAEDLIAKMPDFISRQFKGQWAIYACSMTACALSNMIRLYPELRKDYLEKIASLIELTNTPVIRYYDTEWWKEDAMETLGSNNSHMTYLSIVAWMIGNYRKAGGDCRFNSLHEMLCETLNRRMLLSHDLNLPSFPNGVIFLPDMMFCVLALKDYDTINGEKYTQTINKWLDILKSRYIDVKTGLLNSTIFRNLTAGRVSGAYSGLNTTGIALLDNDFGQAQYEALKQSLTISFGNYAAIKEFLKTSRLYSFEIDAGPVVYGVSPSGTSFAIGAATFFEDWELRQKLLNTATLAGGQIIRKGLQHYRLADIMLSGEAITLAMRTMVDFEKNNNS